MTTENFEGLFPAIARVSGDIEREATEYGLIFVEGRGWDPCAIAGDVPYAVFFQDAVFPKWKVIKFHGDQAQEVK